MIIRPITKEDISSVSELGNANYPSEFHETEESFSSKILNDKSKCFLAEIENKPIAYIIGFPDVLGIPYPINTSLILAENPNCFYIHDLCVDKKYRNVKIANSLLNIFINCTSYPYALTAVLNSEKFWERFGFIKKYKVFYNGSFASYMIKSR